MLLQEKVSAALFLHCFIHGAFLLVSDLPKYYLGGKERRKRSACLRCTGVLGGAYLEDCSTALQPNGVKT